MPSAAGIIMATGAMTLANDFFQSPPATDPKAPVASRVNWKIIPATAIAAAIFFGFEQINTPLAKGLAYLTFATAFIGGDNLGQNQYWDVWRNDPAHPGQTILTSGKTTPLGTLMRTFGISQPVSDPFDKPGTPLAMRGYPYTATQ